MKPVYKEKLMHGIVLSVAQTLAFGKVHKQDENTFCQRIKEYNTYFGDLDMVEICRNASALISDELSN